MNLPIIIFIIILQNCTMYQTITLFQIIIIYIDIYFVQIYISQMLIENKILN